MDGVSPFRISQNQPPAAAVSVRPSFDDHDLEGTTASSRQIYNQALSGFNPSPEQLTLATDAMAVLGRAQVLMDQQKHARSTQ